MRLDPMNLIWIMPTQEGLIEDDQDQSDCWSLFTLHYLNQIKHKDGGIMQRQTTITENSMIWCGAGISIAEILTGTYLASLGFTKGIAVIIVGHLIGCFLLFLAGIIGGQQRLSSMNAAKISFGQNGSKFFAQIGRAHV